MSTLPPLEQPLRVSPLIRVGRWTLLGLGVLWGISRQRSLHAKEEKYRAIRAAEKPAKDAAAAAEKARRYREDMIKLASDTGTPVPPNF